MSTGDGSNFKLSDIELNGGDCSQDYVQVIESTKAAVSDTFCYVSSAQALEFGDASYQGWWNVTMDTSKDDVSFPVGTAFLSAFGSKAVVSTYAGQVVDGASAMNCVGKQYVMFANPLPRTMKLGELIMDGGDCSQDYVQVLESTKAAVTETYCYVSAAQALEFGDASYQGWWNFTMDTSKDDVEVEAGDAFLGNFATKNITITFPSAIPVAE